MTKDTGGRGEQPDIESRATRVPERLTRAVPTPRAIGFSARVARAERAVAQLKEQVRRERERAAHPQTLEISDADIEDEVLLRFADLLRAEDSELYKQYMLTGPVSRSPRRDDIEVMAEVLAMRRTGYIQTLEQQLTRRGGRSRPSDRRLPMAVFERMFLEKGRPEIKANWDSFFGADHLLDYVYEHPVDSNCGTSYQAVRETMKSMLDRDDISSNLAMHLGIQASLELSDIVEADNEWYTLDGTSVPLSREQTAGYSAEHDRLLQAGLTSARFVVHGPGNAWRGPNALILSRLGETVAFSSANIPGNQSEANSVIDLVEQTYRLHPTWAPKGIIADRGFDNTALHVELMERFGIPLITPLRNDPGAFNRGAPSCSCSGERKLMRLTQSDNFPALLASGPKGRIAAGIRPGDRVSASKAFHRWVCDEPNCATKEQRHYFSQDPRLHCFFPHEGEHRGHRPTLRTALLIRRNAAESINATLKHYGVAGSGVEAPSWVSTDAQIQWLVSLSLLAITLRRLVHANGSYEQARLELLQAGLLKRDASLGTSRAAIAHVAAARAA